MKLSEVKTGQKAVIVKVLGHGSFRKRIIEMGFVKDTLVEVLLNAPLEDPVKYRILGYEVSLRHDEAEMIECVAPGQEAPADKEEDPDVDLKDRVTERYHLTEEQLQAAADKQRHVINVALVGNPNCGKTSLFNFASGAHARVGNYSGVTVDASEAHASFEGYEFNLIDLPGTYSLSAYSPEELYVRRYIIDKTPDIIINVIDASNLERNLYLTTQLIDMDIRMVCALNMFDEFTRRGDQVNLETLSTLMGTPMVPTNFKKGDGLKELFHEVIKVYEATSENPHLRHLHINHGHELEHGISEIQDHLKQEQHLRHRYSTRYLAIKLLEHDHDAEKYIGSLPDAAEIMQHRDEAAARVKEEMDVDSETAIMDAKYAFVHGALEEAEYRAGDKEDTYKATHIADKVLSNRYLGFPIFFLILFVMFYVTFIVGQYPMDWIDAGVAWLGDWVSATLPDGPVKDMLVDGVIGGVGSVIVFLPQILILYFFISLMEDSGYMARAAFIMDKLMHKMGLHGKSFIPLIMGFGCNVPAIMATRTIESRRSRLITMLILPFMSCSARLPIYVMITGIFFALKWRALVMVSLYVVGVIMAVIVSKIFSRFVIKGEDTPFVMELPPYRMPTAKAIGRHTWDKGKEYLKKMGGIILGASIIVWALGYFPHNDQLNTQQQQEQSCIGYIGRAIAPAFEPQGFNWKLDVSLLCGVGAKEIVASTIGVLYSENGGDDAEDDGDSGKYSRWQQQMQADGITPLAAYCYLLFVLLYFPCVATIAAIKNESGSWKWAIFAACFTTGVAWCVSALVFQVGSLFV